MTGQGEGWDGTVDEVAVFDWALSPAEIRALADSAHPIRSVESGGLEWWVVVLIVLAVLYAFLLLRHIAALLRTIARNQKAAFAEENRARAEERKRRAQSGGRSG